MLEKLIRVDNAGVLRNGIPRAIDLGRATLVYAENGRGKSTLAAILSSLGSGDAAALAARHTFGGGPQQVLIRGNSGGTAVNATFNGTSWSTTFSNILVFDQHFIERNVYAGSEVDTSQHEALLEFALGTAAVLKKQEVDAAGEDQVTATKRRTAVEQKLKGFMGRLSVEAFSELAQIDKVEERIVGLEQRIAAARDAASIAARMPLSFLARPSFDFSKVSAVLARSLKDIHADAARVVHGHMSHLNQPDGEDAEAWLSAGLGFVQGTSCPFCGQSTSGSPLIASYRDYFDEAYTELMDEVRSLEETAVDALAPGGIAGFEATDGANRERINIWSPQLALPLDSLDIVATRAKLTGARAKLDVVVHKKLMAPLEAHGDEGLREVATALAGAFSDVTTYNEQVLEANKLITVYQQRLATEKIPALQVQLDALHLNRTRFQAEVVTLLDERKQAIADRTAAEAAKKAAREQLDSLMATVLDTFQTGINTWLQKFGADFTVVKLKPTYVGSSGSPRTEYGLSLRGTTVPAGKKSAAPCFQTALSDGDKRTLALAFFLAKLFGEPGHGNRIVVVDDMFTSLDKHRRAQTVDALSQMVRSVAQVIVLAHDAYFLRDVNRRLIGKGICTPTVIEAARAGDGYSELRASFDLDEVCATDYFKHYRALENFLDGSPSESLLATAQGMRPLLEGHLHRRFPGRISEGLSVGAVLAFIKDEPRTSPLSVLQPCLQSLNELNDFASSFHHDTSGVLPRSSVTDSELRAYGTRLIDFLHKGVT